MKYQFIVLPFLVILIGLLGFLYFNTDKQNKVLKLKALELIQQIYDLKEELKAKSENSVTVEEESTKDAIKKLLAKEENRPLSEVTVQITQETNDYARGGVTFYPGGSENSGMFLVAKVNGEWQLAYSGNGAILCSAIDSYDFPTDMVEECVEANGDIRQR